MAPQWSSSHGKGSGAPSMDVVPGPVQVDPGGVSWEVSNRVGFTQGTREPRRENIRRRESKRAREERCHAIDYLPMLGTAYGADGPLRRVGRLQPHAAQGDPDGLVEDLRLERTTNVRAKGRKTHRKRLRYMQKTVEEVRKATDTCSRKHGMRSDQSEEPVRSRKSDTVMERQANQKRESLPCRSCCRLTKNPTLFFQDLALAAKNARKTKVPEKSWMYLKKRMQLVEVC